MSFVWDTVSFERDNRSFERDKYWTWLIIDTRPMGGFDWARKKGRHQIWAVWSGGGSPYRQLVCPFSPPHRNLRIRGLKNYKGGPPVGIRQICFTYHHLPTQKHFCIHELRYMYIEGESHPVMYYQTSEPKPNIILIITHWNIDGSFSNFDTSRIFNTSITT